MGLVIFGLVFVLTLNWLIVAIDESSALSVFLKIGSFTLVVLVVLVALAALVIQL